MNDDYIQEEYDALWMYHDYTESMLRKEIEEENKGVNYDYTVQ